MSAEAADQAVEALRLVDGQPAHAWSLACEAARRADAERDHGAAAVAERARGLAALHLAHLDTAVQHLRVAVAAAGRARSPHLVGEARMSLAFVLNRRGEPRRALRVVDAALADLAGVARARALAQRGAILQQLGRLDEALAGYRAALPVLRAAGDDVWVQRVLSNRAVLNVYRSNLPAAESDLLEAEELCRRGALELQLAFVHENLGFVHTRRGDVPAALHHFDEAERRYQALHVPFGSVLVDRSELLLSVRLVGEGRDAAERATGEFTRLRRRIHLPEAQLLLATAALLDDDPHGALRAARQAARILAAQDRPEWLALARFTMVKSRLLLPDPPRVRLGQLVAVAEALATTGWAATALDARLLVARVALERRRPAQARAQLGRAATARRRGPAEVRARAWQAEAMLRLLDGRRGAARAVSAGLRVLDEHRATLGATDLRAHVSGHRAQLAELGLRIALTGGRPRQVLAWAERGRASHLLQRPVRPPEDPVLARALAELRATIAALEEDGRSRQQAAHLVRRQVALEQAIRDHVRRQPGRDAGHAEHPTPEHLSAALGETALVEFVELDGSLFVITMVDGRVRSRQLGRTSELTGLLDHVPFALRRIARPVRPAAARAALHLLRHAGARFDELLLRPVRREIGERPLVLVPTGALQSMPWFLLPSCVGRVVMVSPSAALWYRAHGRPPTAGGVVVAAGPGLPGARAEVEAVGALYGTAEVLIGSAATTEAVSWALQRSGIAHLATHGRFRADNPLFSSLRLADGPLTVYDLETLRHVPDLVVLAACDSGQALICAGNELLGLAATFLTLGATALVASVVPVPDVATAPLMVALHRRLRAGLPVAAALAHAQQELADDEEALAAAAGFVCLGSGETTARVPRQPTPPRATARRSDPCRSASRGGSGTA